MKCTETSQCQGPIPTYIIRTSGWGLALLHLLWLFFAFFSNILLAYYFKLTEKLEERSRVYPHTLCPHYQLFNFILSVFLSSLSHLHVCVWYALCVCLSFFFFFFFLGPYVQHMEVPRPGVKSELPVAGLHHSHSNMGSEPHL